MNSLAPFAKQKMLDEFWGKLFGIHVDESTHNHKCRLEFWINFHSGDKRRLAYLDSVELDARVDIDEFLRLDNPVKSIQDVKLVDADAVFEGSFQEMRQEVHVFKRKSTAAVQHEINANKEANEKARKLVASAQAQHEVLVVDLDAPSTSLI